MTTRSHHKKRSQSHNPETKANAGHKEETTGIVSGGVGARYPIIEDGHDINLLGRAIKERWDIPEQLRDDAIECVEELIASGNESSKIGGLRCLIAMDSQNIVNPPQVQNNHFNLNVTQNEQELARKLVLERSQAAINDSKDRPDSNASELSE